MRQESKDICPGVTAVRARRSRAAPLSRCTPAQVCRTQTGRWQRGAAGLQSRAAGRRPVPAAAEPSLHRDGEGHHGRGRGTQRREGSSGGGQQAAASVFGLGGCTVVGRSEIAERALDSIKIQLYGTQARRKRKTRGVLFGFLFVEAACLRIHTRESSQSNRAGRSGPRFLAGWGWLPKQSREHRQQSTAPSMSRSRQRPAVYSATRRRQLPCPECYALLAMRCPARVWFAATVT